MIASIWRYSPTVSPGVWSVYLECPPRHFWGSRSLEFIATMYRITNIYVLAAFGTIGGALFGFDIRYVFRPVSSSAAK